MIPLKPFFNISTSCLGNRSFEPSEGGGWIPLSKALTLSNRPGEIGLKDKSGAGIIVDKMKDYIVVNGV